MVFFRQMAPRYAGMLTTFAIFLTHGQVCAFIARLSLCLCFAPPFAGKLHAVNDEDMKMHC